jgi:hypothetical protein
MSFHDHYNVLQTTNNKQQTTNNQQTKAGDQIYVKVFARLRHIKRAMHGPH